MKSIVTYAAMTAVIGALGLTATPSQANGVRHAKRVVVAAAPVVVVGPGGYYSNIVNPRWGYCPMLAYSNSLFFSSGGPLCGDP